MATYTEHYGLHQWESTDDFLRMDFNTDFGIIDGALGALEAGKVELVVGTYTGNGASTRNIYLGFQPLAVMVLKEGIYMGYSLRAGGLALPGYPAGTAGENQIVSISANGFTLHENVQAKTSINSNGSLYHYIAFRMNA